MGISVLVVPLGAFWPGVNGGGEGILIGTLEFEGTFEFEGVFEFDEFDPPEVSEFAMYT